MPTKEQLAHANRRSVQRFLLNPPAAAVLDPTRDVLVLDISIRGARIRHKGLLVADDRVRLRFKPAQNTIHISLFGCVVWSEAIDPADPDGDCMSGIAFADEAAGLRSAIDRLCRDGGAVEI